MKDEKEYPDLLENVSVWEVEWTVRGWSGQTQRSCFVVPWNYRIEEALDEVIYPIIWQKSGYVAYIPEVTIFEIKRMGGSLPLKFFTPKKD